MFAVNAKNLVTDAESIISVIAVYIYTAQNAHKKFFSSFHNTIILILAFNNSWFPIYYYFFYLFCLIITQNYIKNNKFDFYLKEL